MKASEDTPFDPDVEAALNAIDATLVGKAVESRHADMAELALLLRDERPRIDPGFAWKLDERVERRFAPAPPRQRTGVTLPRRRWIWAPAAGVAASLVVAVAIVAGGGGGGVAENGVAGHAAVSSKKAPVTPSAGLRSTTQATQAFSSPSTQAAGAAAGTPSAPLTPPSNGRKVIRAAQLQLVARPRFVDQVSQEVFDVVGRVHGIVNSSAVTATGGPGGYAQFQLSVPGSALSQTMASLSSLPRARVISRTDTSQDVNRSYERDQRRLADERALRSSLLKQLASAFTQAQVDSLKARIRDAERAIARDEAALRSLQHSIAYSQITLTINAGPAPITSHGGAGFTIGRALHDAGRVLTVAAGVALIGLAALLPVGLLVALGWWIGAALRRRRRHQALDLV